MTRGFRYSTIRKQLISVLLTLMTFGYSFAQSSIFQPTDVPSNLNVNDLQGAAELGVKFRTTVNGSITGIRYYKSATNTGTHIGHLWSTSNTTTPLATITFTGETTSGWQQMLFSSPIGVTAGITYVASYFSSAGNYSETPFFFIAGAVVNGPLRALADGEDGPNAVFKLQATSSPAAYPNSTFFGDNYWVDVLFVPTDVAPPVVLSVTPVSSSTNVSISTPVTAVFSEALDPTTVTTSAFELRNASGVLVPATVSYNAGTQTATLTPASALSYISGYTATLKGGTTGARIKDLAGNVLAADYSWTFTTAFASPLPPANGPGGPILVISSAANPFSRFPVEILRAEGLNEFAAADVSTIINAASLNPYDVVILGEMTVSGAQVTLLSNWVNAGGTLIAFRPGSNLNTLLGLAGTGTLADKYLLVNTTSGPGIGIVNQTIQYHGVADVHTLTGGATSLATLYSTSTTATPNPAVSTRTFGSGKAIAFMYDLGKSIIYTRQGNPAQTATETDGQSPIRSDDLFYPGYLDMDKVAIPQADEQQRLLANIIIQSNLAKKPLPRFWYMPGGNKAAIVYTLDDHSTSTGTKDIFDKMIANSPAGGTVANWQKYRATSWFYVGIPLSDSMAAVYNSQGFDLGVHVQNNCVNFTSFANLDASYAPQMQSFQLSYPSLPAQTTHRFHCIVWSDWLTQAKVELSHGIRYSMDYYYWPPSWIQNRPGLFTGSAMPMRFADSDGSLIDIYQGVSNHVNENGIDYSTGINTLLDNAVGSKGYYGFFGTHDDYRDTTFSSAVIASAQSHNVPIISAKQALTWIDGRNNSSFGSITWSGTQLSFSITAYTGADNLKAMLPLYSSTGQLSAITRNGSAISFTTQTIKGMQYAFFDAPIGVNNYAATYSTDATAPVITNIIATPGATGTTATITWTTNEGSDSKVDYGTVSASLNLNSSDNSQVTSHSVNLTGLTPGITYFFRVTSKDAVSNSVTEPATNNSPLSFITPTTCASDQFVADFSSGTTGANTLVTAEGNGGVILTPTQNQDFSGFTIPSGWSESIFNVGGTTTVNGSTATLTGTHIYTNGSFGQGISLDFFATFNSASFQNIGFTADQAFNGNPWVVIGQASPDGSLYARASNGAAVNIGSSLLGSAHRYRIVWNPTSFDFYVDGNTTPAATISLTVSSNMFIQISDVLTGDGALVVDWLRAMPYATSGTFTSRVFDAGSSKSWGGVTWNTDTPSGTSVAIAVRTGNTLIPDGSWSGYTTISTPGGTVGTTSRYIQYRADLSTTDLTLTPVLKDIAISCAAPVSAPNVTTHPVSQTICSGNNVSFTSAASSAPAPIVQWQVSTNGTTWTNISGAVSGTLTFATTIADNAKQYRAVWTNSAGSANSNPGILTVNATPSAPTVTVANNCGNSVLTAANFTGSLLWSNSATTTSITVTNAAAYTVTQTVSGCTSATGSGTSAPKTIPTAPTVTVTNNCGNSVLTAGNFTGSLLWSNSATTTSITVNNAATYTVTQTETNGCTSAAGSGVSAPKAVPTAPTVSVVNNCGNSVLTASNFTGSLLWSNSATTTSITISNAATYTVTQTETNGCTSTAGSGVSAPKAVPVAPTVSVVDNCGNSVLTASNFTGSLLWNNSATTTSITVSNAATYTVTQTETNGCTSAAGSGTSAPKVVPSAPTVGVANNCGNSVLTASNFTGTLLWNNSATTTSITVSNAATYTVTQTETNGCISAAGSGTSAPKVIPSAPTVGVANNCGNSVLTASNFTGSLLWNNSATATSITITNAATYTVTQTETNGCTSAAGSGTSAPKVVPSAPTAGVANNCGNSVLTASNFTGSLLWSNGAIASSITVTNAATYTVTQTGANGCTSAAGSGISVPKAVPPAPAVTVVNNCGNSVLTASNYTGSLLWSNGATTPSITVSNIATYTVTQTGANGCISAAGNGPAFPRSIPPAPVISLRGASTFCQGGSVILTSNAKVRNLWSTGATTQSIVVTTSGSYAVTYTNDDGCSTISAPAIITVNPIPSAPTVSIANNCGNSILTAGNFTGSLSWSNGATTSSITVMNVATYTVKQTVNGCVSPAGSGLSLPKPVPGAPAVTVSDNCGNSLLTVTAGSFAGALLWSNGAATSSITVTDAATYTVTQSINGCSSNTASGSSTPKAIPSAPTVAVINNCGNSVLTAEHFTGSLLWSEAAQATPSITVLSGGTYAVTQTAANGCTSTAGNGVAAPKTIPSAPQVTVNDHCGNSVLTASNYGGSLLWNEIGSTSPSIIVTSPGMYTVIQTMPNGCTSNPGGGMASPMTIPSAPTINAVRPTTFCQGDSVLLTSSETAGNTWSTGATSQSITVKTTGSYAVSFVNANGCTSQLSPATGVIVNSPTSSTTNITICSSQLPYTWNSNSYDGTGTYLAHLTNAAGCDSAATLHLVVKQVTTSSTTVSSCNTYTWNDSTYTASGTYTRLFAGGNAVGCDSTATLILTIKHSTTSSTSATACNGYLWNDSAYTASGTYTKVFAGGNAAGCDSTAILHLTIKHSTTSNTTIIACDNYTWNGSIYTASGTYTKVFAGGNSAGCDSTAILHLTINHSSTSNTTLSACNSYLWNGITYTVSGIYSKLFAGGNAVGCDSTATLNLTIKHSSSSDTTVIACNSYSWNGDIYMTSGIKTYTTINAEGCDSIARLHLTINHSSTSGTTVSACNSYVWNGVTYTTSGDKTYTTTNAAGCDSVATLHLTIKHSTTSSTSVTACNNYTWNDSTYTASGTYTKLFAGGNAVGCDSTATLILTINVSPSAPSIAITEGVTIFCSGGSAVLASDSTTGNQWYRNGVLLNGETNMTYTAITSGNYTVKYASENGCSSPPSNGIVVTVNPLPTLSGSLTGSNTTGVQISYTPTSATGGTTFTWTRALVAGIDNTASSGSGNINEVLVNTIGVPVNVTYVYTLTAPTGCINTQNVVITVNPSEGAKTLTALIKPGRLKLQTDIQVRLDVVAMPNPTTSYFNLIIKSSSKEGISVRVFDAFRKTIENHQKVTPGAIMKLGYGWAGGVYYVEVIQGDQRKVIKIVKAN